MKMKHFFHNLFFALILVILGLTLVACDNDSDKMKAPVLAYFKDIQKSSFSKNDYESEYARKDYFSELVFSDGAEAAMNATLSKTDIKIKKVMGSPKEGTGSCDVTITTIDISSVLSDADNDWTAATSIIDSNKAPTKDFDITIDLVYDISSKKWIIDDTSPIVTVLGLPYSQTMKEQIDEQNEKVQDVIDILGTTAAAATTAAAGATAKVGVAMPTKDLQRWNQDGANMKKALEEAGIAVDLQYASSDIETQVSQVENMITGGCTVLVIAAIDGSSLGTVLATAKEANIPVIAYDRLIMDTDAVSYYATFDNYMVGTIQGQYIETALGLKDGKGPFNMEIFGGSPYDNNARFFYQGAIDVLKPYIDSGKLVVVSGQVDFEKIAIDTWSAETAQARIDNLITANYNIATGTKFDVVLCSNDSTALVVEHTLDNYGYVVGENWPVITGQDCDKANTINMIAGKQSMSVFKDTRTLAAKVVEMVTSIVKGTTVEVNDTKTYDNGKGVVPTFLCTPVFVDKSNYKTILIDSGYYKEADLAS